MLTSSGRPRKACDPLHRGEAEFDTSVVRPSKSQRGPNLKLSEQCNSPTPKAARADRPTAATESCQSVDHQLASILQSPQPASEDRYVGIPKALISTLADLYFENAYNAHLLLHRRSFLESIDYGTARAHVVLGVCAWGANFYRDVNGQATLKEHGFMVEWAQRAGKLVFQELHEFHDDSLVTFVNMSLFWHSQGSWRMAILHKGSACNLLAIIGVGSEALQQDMSLDSEIRRRRCWAGYLMHCHNSESLSNFPAVGMDKVALPWPEADFEAGHSKATRITLESGQSNRGVYTEVIKILTLWSSVVSCIKKTEPTLGAKLPAIYVLHERLLDWWRQLPSDMRLTSTNLAATAKNLLPNILLMNVVYHQSLCALHASIVPLFCWGEGDESWSTARQLSAQLAYEHACTTSELLHAVLSNFDDKLNAMPSFICYGAYCGCAIQIPFMWSSNRQVRERAHGNVKANMKMINAMSTNWKFAALLKIYVRCLYNGHKKNPAILEDEPKYIDASKLTTFKTNAPHVQASILEFIGILRSKEDGYANSGEAPALEIEQVDAEEEPPSRATIPGAYEAAPVEQNAAQVPGENNWPQPYSRLPFTPESLVHYQQAPAQQVPHQPTTYPQPQQQQPNTLLQESQTLDIFQPLLDPEMLDLFPSGELPDFSAFGTSPLNLDHFDLEGWNGCSASSGTGAGAWSGNMQTS